MPDGTLYLDITKLFHHPVQLLQPNAKHKLLIIEGDFPASSLSNTLLYELYQ